MLRDFFIGEVERDTFIYIRVIPTPCIEVWTHYLLQVVKVPSPINSLTQHPGMNRVTHAVAAIFSM